MNRSFAFVFGGLVAGLLLATAFGSAAEPLYVTVAGPDALAPGQTATYNVTLLGGPIGAVNYTVEYYIRGTDLAGGLPLQSSPSQVSSNTTRLALNITAPQAEQTITLVAKASARLGATYENETVERSIVVIAPIVLSATFVNAQPVAALNVTVRFYVDGSLVGSQTIARIEPNGQATARFTYLPVGLQPGGHTARVEADLDRDGVINPAKGEAFVSEIFYRETAPLSTGLTILIGIGASVPAFLVTVAVRRRQKA